MAHNSLPEVIRFVNGFSDMSGCVHDFFWNASHIDAGSSVLLALDDANTGSIAGGSLCKGEASTASPNHEHVIVLNSG